MTPDERVAAGVRRLSDDDAGELLTLQLAAWVSEQHDNPDAHIGLLYEHVADVRTQLADPTQTIWGVREDGRLIGTVRTSSLGPGRAYVGRLAVVPDLVGTGLGSALLRFAEARLPPGSTTVELFTGARSHRNLRLYERFGYAIVGEGPQPGAVRMVKQVAPPSGGASPPAP